MTYIHRTQVGLEGNSCMMSTMIIMSWLRSLEAIENRRRMVQVSLLIANIPQYTHNSIIRKCYISMMNCLLDMRCLSPKRFAYPANVPIGFFIYLLTINVNIGCFPWYTIHGWNGALFNVSILRQTTNADDTLKRWWVWCSFSLDGRRR
jgi:hypothetical protein